MFLLFQVSYKCITEERDTARSSIQFRVNGVIVRIKKKRNRRRGKDSRAIMVFYLTYSMVSAGRI